MPDLRVKDPNLTASIEWRARIRAYIEESNQEEGAEISCWMWTGECQTMKMRIRYLQLALNQDVCYFDTEVRTSDIVYAINADAVIVQDAISEKLVNFIHYMGTFVSGFVLGYTAVWQFALITLAVVPLIVVIGGIHTIAMAKLSSKSQDALSQASNIADRKESSTNLFIH